MAERRSPLAVAAQESPAPDEAAKPARSRSSRPSAAPPAATATAEAEAPAPVVTKAAPRSRTAGTKGNSVTVISDDARIPEAWTVAELDDVRGELIADLERLERDVAAMQANITAVMHDTSDGAGDDQADTGAKAYEREHELTLLASTRETLFQSQYALARIAEGSYGLCEQCGGAIGKLRLQAFPRASLCVACKQRQERR